MENKSKSHVTKRAILVWGAADLYFILSVITAVLFGILSPDLQKELNLSSAQIGLLGSVFFLSYGIAQLFAGGLSYQGLLPSRSEDIFAFIFAYGLFSDDLNEFNRENGDPVQDYEVILELNYRIQVAPWLFVQPDVQVVINPDGRSDIDDALVIGFGVGTVL